MLSPLRNRFGIPGVISVIALVFAMLGGAYAATNSNDGKKASASAKAKKGPRGPRGKTGPAGPAGPAGPQGSAGAAGAKGDKGDTGGAGAAGAAGKSVTGVTLAPGEGPTGEECEEGGVEYTSASGVNVVCNGEEGPQGPQGAAGAAGPPGPTCPNGECLLPVGATETGVWSFSEKGAEYAYFDVTFPLRLPAGAAPSFYFVTIAEAGGATAVAEGCPGTVSEPKSASEKFCMYEGLALSNATGVFVEAGAPQIFGFLLYAELDVDANEAWGGGTWAVTR